MQQQGTRTSLLLNSSDFVLRVVCGFAFSLIDAIYVIPESVFYKSFSEICVKLAVCFIPPCTRIAAADLSSCESSSGVTVLRPCLSEAA